MMRLSKPQLWMAGSLALIVGVPAGLAVAPGAHAEPDSSQQWILKSGQTTEKIVTPSPSDNPGPQPGAEEKWLYELPVKSFRNQYSGARRVSADLNGSIFSNFTYSPVGCVGRYTDTFTLDRKYSTFTATVGLLPDAPENLVTSITVRSGNGGSSRTVEVSRTKTAEINLNVEGADTLSVILVKKAEPA